MMNFCVFSELNLRIWQQSKKMFEQTGKRPVVYNNKCGQMCGVSLKFKLFSFLIIFDYFSVVQKKFVIIQKNLFDYNFYSHRSMQLIIMKNYIMHINNV